VARPLRSSAVLTLALSIVAASCGGSLSLSDYADEVEALVSTMNGAIDDAEREWRAAPPSVDATQKFHAHRVEARKTFMVALEALEPPESVAEFHAIALNLLGRLRDAEIAMAERADSIQTMEEMSTLWDGPEGHAFQ
jgi:hypothetical protein